MTPRTKCAETIVVFVAAAIIVRVKRICFLRHAMLAGYWMSNRRFIK